MRGLGEEKELEINTTSLLKLSLESSAENRRGLSNVIKVIKMTAKIEEAENTGAVSLKLEDAEFEFLKKSVDQTEWLPLAMKFPEFFLEIERVNKEDK